MLLTDFLKDFDKEPIEAQIERNKLLHLPDGTYKVEFIDAYHGEKNGYEHFMFTFKVIEGKYKGMRENIFTPLETETRKGNKMPESVIKKSIFMIRLMGYYAGVNITLDTFEGDTVTEIYEKLREAFMGHFGVNLELTIRTTPNAKNPDHPYRNQYIDELKEPQPDPFADSKFEEELELPF